jgi:hypothetical protein
MGKMYTELWWENEENRSFGRHRRGWEDNIKMDLQDVGWGHGLNRSGPREEQVTGTCECCNEPPGSIKCGEFFNYQRTCKLLRKDSTP